MSETKNRDPIGRAEVHLSKARIASSRSDRLYHLREAEAIIKSAREIDE